MSLTSPSSSIQKLNSDVLLYIITLNADMFSDPTALSTTTRTASHVCENWRNLTLDTPSLWARLIDLNDVTLKNYEWLNELLRRSGTASLWIRGDHIQIGQLDDVPPPEIIPSHLFFDITRENWHRIEKLVVCLQSSRDLSPHSPHQWTALHLPAPQLDTFDVTFKWTSFTLRLDVSITTIFAGHAPELLHFSLEIFTVDERAPWLCQLRTMLFHQKYTIGHALFPDKLHLNVTIRLHNMDAFTVVSDVLAVQELSSAVELRISTAFILDLRPTAFFNCLTSIETIYANVNSLIYLGNLQNATYIEKKHTLFPFLKVVNLVVDQCEMVTLSQCCACWRVLEALDPISRNGQMRTA